MRKRVLGLSLCAVLFALCSSATAQQQEKIPRIGFLSVASISSLSPRLDAFREGLLKLGYVEEKNIAIEYRSAEGKPDRLPELASELVRLKVDCIFTAGTAPTRAAKQATSKIPIVMGNPGNPIQSGFVVSLARPGGNLTGLISVSTDLAGKRLELLEETISKLSRVAIFWSPASTADLSLKENESAARLLKVQFIPLEVRSLDDLENAFGSIAKKRANAAIAGGCGFFVTHQTRFVELAAKHRLPAMYPEQEFVFAGGLMTYATSIPDLTGAPLFTWTRFSKVPSRPICPSSNRPSLNSSSI
jgi:putative ABC transport system substrate-binding protein